MAVNKNALIRYKTIDKCLRNRYKEWTLDDLIEACSDALYEYEGKDTYVSKRTVQLDIQMMRSDKLGYNAPIVVYNRKFYTYEDEDYSITNSPLSEHDLEKLTESVAFLKQFQGFSHFRELDGMIQKLEAHIYAQKTDQNSVIDFEKNDHLKGLEYLDQLYKAIIKKECLSITYKSFKARQENTFYFHPYLLKEFRNRWFLIGCQKTSAPIMNIALDRIIAVSKSNIEFKLKPGFDSEVYFKDVIGVSVSPTLPTEEVILFITHKLAPYVITKPLHSSQKVIDKDAFGVTISLNVQHNFELEKDILGLGEGCKVIAPPRLKRQIKTRLQMSGELYSTEVSQSNVKRSMKKLEYNGYSVLNHVYGLREVRRLKRTLDQYFSNFDERPFSQRKLLKTIPDLKMMLLNKNLLNIIKQIDKKAVLTKAIYFDKPTQKNWYVTWHQDITVNVENRVEVEGYSSWTKKQDIVSVCPPESILQNTFTIRIHLDDTDEKNGALKVLSGSHKKRLNDDEISIITNNSVPNIVEVGAGGIMLMKPLLLHASSKAQNQKRRRVIHLEFTSSLLSNPLKFLEEESI